MLTLAMLLLIGQAAAAQPAPVRVADAACGRCHEKIYASYLRTPMAHASGPAAEQLMPGVFRPAASPVEYKLSGDGASPTLSWRNLQNPAWGGQWKLDYYLGSGHLGVTWLYSIDHYLFESPVAWYTSAGKLDMKPGLAGATRQPPSLPMDSACMRCHMSGVEASDPGTLNRYRGLPFREEGITCESCHGDATRHVASGGRAPVMNPARLDAQMRDGICMSCHLEGDVSVERAGHSGLDYRPGERLADYLAYYVYAKSDPEARGVSEVEQLSQSVCKRMSGERMSCMSCHDPHFRPAAGERVAFYRAKCLACHSEPAFARSHHPENQDCTSCHMPHNGAKNIPHVAWTDHRILRRPEPATAPAAIPTNVLQPVFSPGANQRDLGMAYYVAFMDGNRAAEPEAWSLLQAQKAAMADDRAGLDALGVLSVEHKENAQAEEIFRRVLALDANDLTALSNLGVLVARRGDLPEAARILHEAFARNGDIAGLAMNLARIECMLGRTAEVQKVLETTLIYNPGIPEIRQYLDQAGRCSAAGQQAGSQ